MNASARRTREANDIARRLRVKATILAILLLGALLRIHALGAQSMWFDEAARQLEARASLSYLLSNARQDTLPPGYALTIHCWQRIGQQDFWLRLPSVFAGVALIALVLGLAQKLYDDMTALVAASIMALFPYQVFHSQQANLYSFLALFSGMITLAFWQALHRRGRRWWAAYVLSAILGFYTHYFIGLLLIALHLFELVRSRHLRAQWRHILTADALIVSALLPLARFIALKLGEVAGGFWLTRPDLVAPLSTLHLFTVSYSLPPVIVPVAFLLTALVVTLALMEIWFSRRRRLSKPSQDLFIVLLVFSPLVVLVLVAQLIPIYLARTLIVVTPVYAILLARGLILARLRSPMPYIAAMLAIIMLVSLYNYYFNDQFAKPGYRQASAFLETRAQMGDLVLHTGNGSYIPFLLYRSGQDHFLLDGDPAPHHPPKLHEVAGGRSISSADMKRYDRVWLVVALDHSVEYQREVMGDFDAEYELVGETMIGDVIVRLYDLGA